MLGGIGLELGTIQTDMTQGCQLQRHRQFDGLLEAILKKRAVIFAKIAQHPKIGAVHLRDEHEGQVFAAAALDLPGAENAPAVGVDQNGDDLPGMIRMLAFDAIEAFNAGGIQLLEKFGVEVAFMILRQKIEDIAGKKLVLMKLNRTGFEGNGHEASWLDSGYHYTFYGVVPVS
jgi:hypothetical protein